MEAIYESAILDTGRGRFRDALKKLAPGEAVPPSIKSVGKLVLIAELLHHTALLTSKWVEVQVGATRSYAIWAVTA